MCSANYVSKCFHTAPDSIFPPDPGSVTCFLCGNNQLHSSYRNHLTLDHGVVHDVEFLVQVSLHKQLHSSLPPLNNPVPGLSLTHSSSQTELSMGKDVFCAKCKVDDTEGALKKKDESTCEAWPCKVCPMIYSRRYHHDQHMLGQHLWTKDQLNKVREPVRFTEREFNNRQRAATIFRVNSSTTNCSGAEGTDESQLSPKAGGETKQLNFVRQVRDQRGNKEEVELKAGITPLPTDMRCYFDCGEVFKKDYQLKLHLKLKHSMEDPEELRRAEWAAQKEIELTRRSGRRLPCALCPVVLTCKSSLWSHVTSKHNITYQAYKAKYGDIELGEQALFQCRICQRSIKHEQSIVTKHLKVVHRINWTQYVAMVRGEEGAGLERLPEVEMVQCKVCGNSVKYLKPHVKKVHNINMEEYKCYVDSEGKFPLPEIALVKCEICSSDVKCFKEHLKKTHHITEEEYEDIFAKEKTPPMIETLMCEICPSKVRDLPSHLMSTHKMNLEKYNEVVGDKTIQDEVELKRPLNNNYFENFRQNIETEDIRANQTNCKSRLSPESMRFSSSKPSKAEMKDSTNTRCSSCKVDLVTRKRFVTHCQVVHEIKFKKKSGEALVQPLQESGLFSSFKDSVTRILDSDSSQLKNDRGKKRAASFDPFNMEEAENKGVKRTKLFRVEESVSCDQCHKMFSSVGNMEKHKRFSCRPVER